MCGVVFSFQFGVCDIPYGFVLCCCVTNCYIVCHKNLAKLATCAQRVALCLVCDMFFEDVALRAHDVVNKPLR